jgi:crotonobetainyl-CoA:carnitine CoA-transferase CaiB-like acyl-CoA transferase
MTRLLAGVRVIESAQLLNGDTVGMFLGDLGADVVKVEVPPRGDYLRYFLGQLVPGYSIPHLQVNKNKRSVALDLKKEEGREAFLRLVESAEVFVDGNRPGVLDRLGVGYEVQRARNARIVYVQHTAYGTVGPYRDIPTHGMMMGALAGAHLVEEGADGFLHRRDPDVNGTEMGGEATVTGAVHAAMWACAALVRARATGEGAYLDVSAADAVVLSAYFPVLDQLNGPRVTDRSGMAQMEGGELVGSKYQFYKTRDDKVLLFCCLERKFWRNFCRAAGREDLLEGEAADNADADWGSTELRSQLTSLFRTRDLADWVEMAAAHDIAMGPANQGVVEMSEDPGIGVREIILDQHHPVAGDYAVVGAPAMVAGDPYLVRYPAPSPGEQTSDVLLESGFTASEVAALLERGAAVQAGQPGLVPSIVS